MKRSGLRGVSFSRKRSCGSDRAQGLRSGAVKLLTDTRNLCLYLAAREEIVITCHGRPAGVLIGFTSDDG